MQVYLLIKLNKINFEIFLKQEFTTLVKPKKCVLFDITFKVKKL